MTDLSPRARALLNRARDTDDPTQSDRQRVRAMVLLRVGGIAALAGTIASSKSAAAASGTIFSSAIAKLGAAALVVTSLGAGTYVAMRSASDSSSPVKSTPSSAEVAPRVVPKAAPTPNMEPEAQPVEIPPSDVKPSEPSSRARRVQNSDLEGEVRLLKQADAALRAGNWNGALGALSTHAKRYPRGALRQEREGVRAMALCRAGHFNEGRSVAKRFLNVSPNSPLGHRIRVACFPED